MTRCELSQIHGFSRGGEGEERDAILESLRMHYSTIPLFHDSIIPIFHHFNIPMPCWHICCSFQKRSGSGNAFLLDYKPAERAQYIDAFFANIDWNAVEQRMISQR
jgi:hypothetical protein